MSTTTTETTTETAAAAPALRLATRPSLPYAGRRDARQEGETDDAYYRRLDSEARERLRQQQPSTSQAEAREEQDEDMADLPDTVRRVNFDDVCMFCSSSCFFVLTSSSYNSSSLFLDSGVFFTSFVLLNESGVLRLPVSLLQSSGPERVALSAAPALVLA